MSTVLGTPAEIVCADQIPRIGSVERPLEKHVAERSAQPIKQPTRLAASALLFIWGAPYHAMAVIVLLLAQILAMRRLFRDPKTYAPWYNGTGIVFYVSGMMIAAFALRNLGGAG